MAGSPWKKRKWENRGTSEEVQRVPKSVRNLGSVKASEFPAEPQGSRAEGEGWDFKEDVVEVPGPEGAYSAHSVKAVAPGSFLRSCRETGKYWEQAGQLCGD